MAGLTSSPLEQLLEAARKEGRLPDLYRHAREMLKNNGEETGDIPPELREYMHAMMASGIRPALARFIETAREELKIVDVEIVSAVPLKEEQLVALEYRLIKTLKKRINVKTSVDHDLIGGFRVVIGDHVVDNSIKTQMEQIRESLYKGVYFQHENISE